VYFSKDLYSWKVPNRLKFLALHLRDHWMVRSFLAKLPKSLYLNIRKCFHKFSRFKSPNSTKLLSNFSLNSNELVSIVLPNFNHGDFLESAIQSVLEQDYKNLELIVVDDGSTDHSIEVLNRFIGKARFRVIFSEHAGISSALNIGFANAKGSLFSWTSADNLMAKGAVSFLVKALMDNPGCGMAHSDYQIIDENGVKLLNSSFRSYDQDTDHSYIIRTNRSKPLEHYIPDNYIGPFFMYRREIAKYVGDYAVLLGFEDYDYWIRVSRIATILHIPSDGGLYSYRLHPKTLTASSRENRTYKNLIKHLKYMDS
jgi:glycosyltransferase involved in cell wall biosynthesis